MNVGFYCDGLSEFRHAIPLMDALHRVRPDVEKRLIYSTSVKKYNTLGTGANLETFKRIAATRPYLKLKRRGFFERTDILFTIESVGARKVRWGRHYALQNGFDYRGLSPTAPDKTVYLMNYPALQNDLPRYNARVGSKLLDVPIPFWNAREYQRVARERLRAMGYQSGKVATLFYADEGYVEEMNAVIATLERNGFFVVVKQRRKNQTLNAQVKHPIYDDDWYPSEGVCYPSVSDVVIGAGTSAFSDLFYGQTFFVFLRLPHPRYPDHIEHFIYPPSPTFHMLKQDELGKLEGLLSQARAPQLDLDAIEAYADRCARELLG